MHLKKFQIITLICLVVFSSSCSSDDEPQKTIPTVILSDLLVIEGNDPVSIATIDVGLKEVATEDISLSYETSDGSAFQKLDYKKTSGTITIPAGSTQASISIDIYGDDIIEGNEVFRVLFDTDMELKFSKTSILVTISNDDTKLPYGVEDYTTPIAYEGWSSVWADEFDGTSINTSWWTHEIGNGSGGWGNNELEYYTNRPENSRVEGGNLIIEARNDDWQGHDYTSARMITKGKKSVGYSRTDIRAKLPYSKGIWPALWMLGNNIDAMSWPACGEIDIMELLGQHPATSHATVHWGSDFANRKYTGKSYTLSDGIFHDRFHVFSVVREANQMWFFVDDILINEFSSRDLQGQPNPFNGDFFYIFNVAVGGNWPGNPDATTVFPQQMVVDYIRVFEKE